MRNQQAPSLTPVDSDATRVMAGIDTSALRPGFLLGHTYLIESLIARGGMGEAYRAKNIELGTEHVIKVVLPSLASDPKIVEMFREEGRKLARLRNDAIVNYEGFSRDERGLLYLVMEYVEGESLATILRRRCLEPGEVLRLRDRVATGLAAAHDVGIVHRDISPENIILPEGRVERAKLIDFGIAKSMDPADVTLIGGDFAGKYGFVSPEQAGLFGGRVDLRSDIYSLGLVLAAAAIGFGTKLDMGNSPSTVITARQRVPDLSAVPAPLRPVIAPMLQPRPEDRPSSMRAMLDDGKVKLRAPVKWLGIAIAVGALLTLSLVYVAVSELWPPPSPDEIRMKVAEIVPRYRCMSLDYDVGVDGSVRLSGFAVAPDGIDGLRRDIGAIRGAGLPSIHEVHLRARPYCDVVALLNPLLQRKSGPVADLSLASDTAQATIGEALVLDIQAPDFDGAVYIDYVGSEGAVLHLFPNDNDRERVAVQPKRRHFVLGRPPGKCWTLSGNTGEQLVTLIAAKRPLFTGLRPEIERLSDYLAALSEAMSKMPQEGLAASVLFFTLRDPLQPANLGDACPPG